MKQGTINNVNWQNNNNRSAETISCPNCGFLTGKDSCFCPYCGQQIKKNVEPVHERKTNYEEPEKTHSASDQHEEHRKETYHGEVRKCPNCGEILKSFSTECPSCGYEFRNSNTSNYILDFSIKLERATSSKQKDDLIRHFVMPNTKEDIYEFMILAATNLETGGDNTDAWLIKLEQAHQKAKLLFGDSSEIKYIDDVYYKAIKNYKKIKRNDKAGSIGSFVSKHWFGILLIVLGTLSFVLIILGSIFHVGVVNWEETVTTGHLWWKKDEIKPHSTQVLTILGGILAYVTLMTALIGKRRNKKKDKDDSEDDEE